MRQRTQREYAAWLRRWAWALAIVGTIVGWGITGWTVFWALILGISLATWIAVLVAKYRARPSSADLRSD